MTTTDLDYRPESPAGVLVAARDRRRVADAAEADLLGLAVEWAVMHPVESIGQGAACLTEDGRETDLAIAGPGAPLVAEFCVPEFAAAVGLSPEAGRRFLGEAVELRYRLPRLYRRVVAGDLVPWKARLVARETIRLSVKAAGFVDAQVAAVAHKTRPAQLDRLVAEAIGRFMPAEVERLAAQSWDRRHITLHDHRVSFTASVEVTAELDIADALDLDAALAAGAAQQAALGSTAPVDVRRAQALGDLARHQPTLDLTHTPPDTPRHTPRAVTHRRQVVLYVHLCEQSLAGHDPTARLERGDTVVWVEQVRAWCGSPETAQVVLTPVLDLAACVEVDSDVVPDRIAEHVAVRDRTCVFPGAPARPEPEAPRDTAAMSTTPSHAPAAAPPAPATSPPSADDTTA